MHFPDVHDAAIGSHYHQRSIDTALSDGFLGHDGCFEHFRKHACVDDGRACSDPQSVQSRYPAGGCRFQSHRFGDADDTIRAQMQLRYTTLRISELIRTSKLVCAAPGNDLVLWITRVTQRQEVLRRFYQFSQLPSHTSAQTVALIVVLTIVISTLAGLLPAWKAAGLKPVEALRSE